MLKYFVKIKSSRTSSPAAGFAEDYPLETELEDSFLRRNMARKIANTIMLTDNKKSFAIGILGEYGSGKTSFMKLIELCVDRDKAAFIHFNPWSAESTPNIQKDFFDLLSRKIYEIDPKLSGLVLDYSRKLSRVDSSAETLIKRVSFLTSLFKVDGYTDDYDKINKSLRNSEKKIIICIDDLDRLYNSEVMEVLRLIRNTASFANIFYLVAYERGYIQEAIRSVNANASLTYLDKIVQLEIPLPKRENDALLKLLEQHLFLFISEVHQNEFREYIVRYGFKNQFEFAYRTVFRNSRDVVRFINTFKLSYDLLGNEVSFPHLFVLELIKFRYPLIYDMLFENRSEIFSLRPLSATHEEFYQLKTVKEGDKDELAFTAKLQELQYPPSDITLINGLLRNLFNRSINASKDSKNAIVYPQFFERYFRYRLAANEISEKKFQQALANEWLSLTSYIDECIERRAHDAITNRILQEKPQDKKRFELLVRALFYVGPKCISIKSPTSFDYKALQDKIWNYEDQLTKKYYRNNKDGYRNFLQDLFENATSPYLFQNELIYHIKKDQATLPLTNEQLIGYQVSYFQKLTESDGLTKDALWLMWATREKTFKQIGSGYVSEDWRFEPAIIPVIITFLKTKDPFYFIADSINRNIGDENIVSIHKQILALFDRPEDLRTIVEKNAFLKDDVKSEYLDFFDQCAAVEFKQAIEFEFKTSLRKLRNED